MIGSLRVKIGTFCLLFLSSLVFTALEFDSNYFGILLWKVVKPSEHDETKPPIRKIFQKYKLINKTTFIGHLYTKVMAIFNKVSYIQKIKKCYNLENSFQRQTNFSQ